MVATSTVTAADHGNQGSPTMARHDRYSESSDLGKEDVAKKMMRTVSTDSDQWRGWRKRSDSGVDDDSGATGSRGQRGAHHVERDEAELFAVTKSDEESFGDARLSQFCFGDMAVEPGTRP